MTLQRRICAIWVIAVICKNLATPGQIVFYNYLSKRFLNYKKGLGIILAYSLYFFKKMITKVQTQVIYSIGQ